MSLRIALIGGTIEALILAHHLLEKNDVVIIEMEAELGLPVNHPGRVIDQNLLDTYFTSEQQTFLALQSNPDGWGCRWDWIMKHLAANIARHGVQFLTRTRVLSSTKKNQTIHLELSSTEREKPTLLIVDRSCVDRKLRETGTWKPPTFTLPTSTDHPPFSHYRSVVWRNGCVRGRNNRSQPRPSPVARRRYDRIVVAQ